MKFWEAMKALEEGKKVRKKRWEKDAFLPTRRNLDGSEWIILATIGLNEDWELYEEPEQTYSFMEVVKGLKEGKEFRRKSWPNKEYSIKLFVPGIMNSKTASACYLYPEDFEASDWVEIT